MPPLATCTSEGSSKSNLIIFSFSVAVLKLLLTDVGVIGRLVEGQNLFKFWQWNIWLASIEVVEWKSIRPFVKMSG